MDQEKNIGTPLDSTGYLGNEEYVNPIATSAQKAPLATGSTTAKVGFGIGTGNPQPIGASGAAVDSGLGIEGALPSTGVQPAGNISVVSIQAHQEKHNAVGA